LFQGQRPSPSCLLALADLSACYGADPRAVLRCSLRAAASCSRFFAQQEACLPPSLFQPPVLRAMAAAAVQLRLAVPAAVLCQLLAPPDNARAFQVLKATPAAALDVEYFEFLWEVCTRNRFAKACLRALHLGLHPQKRPRRRHCTPI
jgi:hypothetical protein